MSRQLRIVTHKKWLVDTFACDRNVVDDPRVDDVQQDFGFDIDQNTADDSWWWAPGAWAASARSTGVDIPLLSCGPRWMLGLPYEYVRRKIVVCSADEAYETVNKHIERGLWRTKRVFAKLPEAKVDYFPAQLFDVGPMLGKTLVQGGLPYDVVVQLSEDVEFGTEARFFVAHRNITAASLYKIGTGDTVWGSEHFDKSMANVDTLVEFTRLKQFAERVAGDNRVDQPPGWVLDVGMLDGEPAVVEANAAWSSGPYDCEPFGVLDAIIAAHDTDGSHKRWLWSPGDVLRTAGPITRRDV